MRIEPAILGKHLEAAAIEQLSEELRQEGYEIEHEPAPSQTRFQPDLVARRGTETVVFEFKVVGGSDVRLRDAAIYARERGARFRLILIRPERDVHIEVDDLESVLFFAISDPMHPDLQSLSDRTLVNSIHGVDVDAIHVEHGEVEVGGSATVSVTLTAQGGDIVVASLDFPFTFALRLGTDRKILGDPDIDIDLSEWTGSD